MKMIANLLFYMIIFLYSGVLFAEEILFPISNGGCGPRYCNDIQTTRYYRSELETFFQSSKEINMSKEVIYNQLKSGVRDSLHRFALDLYGYIKNKVTYAVDDLTEDEHDLDLEIENLRLLADMTKKYFGAEGEALVLDEIKKVHKLNLWDEESQLCYDFTEPIEKSCPKFERASLVELIEKIPSGEFKEKMLSNVNNFDSIKIQIDDGKVCPSSKPIIRAKKDQPMQSIYATNNICDVTTSMIVKKGIIGRGEGGSFIGGPNASHNCKMVVLHTFFNKKTNAIEINPNYESYLIGKNDHVQTIGKAEMKVIVSKLIKLIRRP